VVDDEPETRSLLEHVISECAAQVTAAASAHEAFVLVQHHPFDLLVSDVGMPEEDGHSLIRKIRLLTEEKGGSVPAIALTVYARSEDRAAAFRAGFDMHLSKPIDPSELLAIIGRLVSRQGGRASSKGAAGSPGSVH
jgi:CheY-like chemotaxis protein